MAIELLNIDCMEFMKGVAENHFDLAITDPPYGRSEDGGRSRSGLVRQKNGSASLCLDGGYKKKQWDKEPPSNEYFSELRRVSKHQIIFGANYMPEKLQGGAIVWDKINDGGDQSGAEIAYCSMISRVELVRFMWRGMMQGDSIGSFRQQGNKSLNERRIHPTQKPVKLYEWMLRKFAKSGWNILDTHLGSGSSAIAAHKLGFDFVGCEIDCDYYSAAKSRLDDESRQLEIF